MANEITTSGATDQPMRNTYLAALVAAGRSGARDDKVAIDALTAAVALGKTEEDFTLYAYKYHVGYLAVSCQWTAKQSAEWLKDKSIKKRIEKGEAPTPFQRAYATSRQRWSRVRDAAGFTKAKKGRAPKVATDDDEEGDKPEVTALDIGMVAIPDCKSLDTARMFLVSVDKKLAAFLQSNSAVLTGDAGMFLRDAVAAFHANVGRAIKGDTHETPKPKASKAEKEGEAVAA